MTTETLSANDLVPAQFEPKRSNRWILETDGLDAFLVKKITLPKWSAKDGSPEILSPLEIELYDPISPNAAQQIMKFCMESSTASRLVAIKVLDPVGTVISRWELTAKVRMVDFGNLDYNDGNPIVIKASFDVSKMELCY